MLKPVAPHVNKIGLARHWSVGRSTLDEIIRVRGLRDLQIRKTAQFAWSDIWRMEGLGPVHDVEAATAPLLTTAEVAAHLGVSPRTVCNYVLGGRLRAIELGPKTRRFHGWALSAPRCRRGGGQPAERATRPATAGDLGDFAENLSPAGNFIRPKKD